MLEEMVVDGFPESGMPETICGFHQYREDITSANGVVLYKDTMHAAHQGVSMMTAHIESSVFWPGMAAYITTTRNSCEHCHRMAPSQSAVPPTPPIPPLPGGVLRHLHGQAGSRFGTGDSCAGSTQFAITSLRPGEPAMIGQIASLFQTLL